MIMNEIQASASWTSSTVTNNSLWLSSWDNNLDGSDRQEVTNVISIPPFCIQRVTTLQTVNFRDNSPMICSTRGFLAKNANKCYKLKYNINVNN